MRVNKIKREDPQFFAQMVEWKELFNQRRKEFLDKRIETKSRVSGSGIIIKGTFTIEDALKMMYETYLDDDYWYWGLVPA